ncbi:MAG: hypothetical protein RIC16_01390 [Rhodospirillales bacterium]
MGSNPAAPTSFSDTGPQSRGSGRFGAKVSSASPETSVMEAEYRKSALRYVGLMFRKLAFWRAEPPIATVEAFSEFVETRAKFIAQVTLYGYLKTRAGTRFPELFKDEVFGQSLDIAKWQIYLMCLSDLMVYAGGLLSQRADAGAEDLVPMTRALAEKILARDMEQLEPLEGFADTRAAILGRLQSTEWRDVEDGEGPFDGSQNALVKWAPVAPQLKEFDTEIVINSMRFKWKGVRDQIRSRLEAAAVIDDWRRSPESELNPAAR